jgi:dTDP-glucose 4,6-dehydratase
VRILVCGGLGFIGLNFVQLVYEQRPDWQVTVLDKQTYASHSPNELNKFGSPKFVRGDICDRELVDSLVRECDGVINFAAETHNDNSIAEPDLFFETNVIGVLSLAEACRRYGVRLHHVSTDEVFGDTTIESRDTFNRDSPYRPSSPYSASKASADLLLRAWHRTYGLPVTISNCTNNFGEFQHSEKLIPATVKRIAEGLSPRIYGDGSNVRDWIHVLDHCRGVLLAFETGRIGETYLFGASDEVSNVTLAKELISASGKFDLGVEFVTDRPGHDIRYALDWHKSQQELGWKPIEPKICDSVGKLYQIYASQGSPNSERG